MTGAATIGAPRFLTFFQGLRSAYGFIGHYFIGCTPEPGTAAIGQGRNPSFGIDPSPGGGISTHRSTFSFYITPTTTHTKDSTHAHHSAQHSTDTHSTHAQRTRHKSARGLGGPPLWDHPATTPTPTTTHDYDTHAHAPHSDTHTDYDTHTHTHTPYDTHTL